MLDLFSLLYVSQSTAPDAADVIAIADESQSNNQRDSITGLLLFDGKCWCQYIEGPQRAVADLYARLQRDSRHCNMSVLQHGRAPEERAFPNWRMGYAFVADEHAIAKVLSGDRADALNVMRAAHRLSTRASGT